MNQFSIAFSLTCKKLHTPSHIITNDSHQLFVQLTTGNFRIPTRRQNIWLRGLNSQIKLQTTLWEPNYQIHPVENRNLTTHEISEGTFSGWFFSIYQSVVFSVTCSGSLETATSRRNWMASRFDTSLVMNSKRKHLDALARFEKRFLMRVPPRKTLRLAPSECLWRWMVVRLVWGCVGEFAWKNCWHCYHFGSLIEF